MSQYTMQFTGGESVVATFETGDDSRFRIIAEWARAKGYTKAQVRTALLAIAAGNGTSATPAHNAIGDELNRYLLAREIIDAVTA